MADMSTSDAYLKGDPVGVASVEIAGTRTLVCVPMLKENELIGAIADLSPGGAPLHRQAGRTGRDLRPPSSDSD